MNSSDDMDLAKINQAAEAISEDISHAGVERAKFYATHFDIPESEMPLALANAYYRLAVHTNALAFRLNSEDLAKRMMQAIKDAAQEAIIDGQ